MLRRLLALFILFAASAFAQAAHSVTLTWSWVQGAGGAATGFIVQRGTVAGGPYTAVATITSPATLTYVDASSATNVLAEGQKYCYVVQATGNGGTTSAFSNEACGTIPFLLPNAPTGLSVVVK